MRMAATLCPMTGFEFASDRAPAGDATRTLETFLRGVERRAWRVAELATGQREDALDLVQEAMLGFVSRYGERTPEE